MTKLKRTDNCSSFFWDCSYKFINKELPETRRKSINTIQTYRRGLNFYIDFLEDSGISRKEISFLDFNKEMIKKFLVFLVETQKLSPKTCNLYITAICALLSFASDESIDITPIYLTARKIKGLTIQKKEIEYFEDNQLKQLLSAYKIDNKKNIRNRMILILGYDAALRVSELVELTVGSLHLNAETPFITVHGKEDKYRNVPLMKRTKDNLMFYLKEFHDSTDADTPLFYTTTYGKIHKISDDSVQNILKKASMYCSEKIEMPEYVHFHMLRKTKAMDLYKSGCPLSYIQQLLGHECISTTSGFYAFATLKNLSDAIEKAAPSNNIEKIWKADKKILKNLYRL